MKRDKLKPCVLCGEGIAHDGQITFYQVKLVRMGINIRAIQAQHGLEMILGHPGLAQVMGPDEDLAVKIGDWEEALVCDNCALMKSVPLMRLSEIINERAAEAQLPSVEDRKTEYRAMWFGADSLKEGEVGIFDADDGVVETGSYVAHDGYLYGPFEFDVEAFTFYAKRFGSENHA